MPLVQKATESRAAVSGQHLLEGVPAALLCSSLLLQVVHLLLHYVHQLQRCLTRHGPWGHLGLPQLLRPAAGWNAM